MVFDEFAELRGPLVVGGVRLEDQVVLVVEDASQFGGGVALVVDDVEVVELDAGLHDQGDDAGPDVVEPEVGEGFAVGVDGAAGAVGGGGGEDVEGLVGAAGDGHLGADDVHRAGRVPVRCAASSAMRIRRAVRWATTSSSRTSGSSAQDMQQSRWILE